MNQVQTQLESIEVLPHLLPDLLSGLSIHRGQIVVDSLRGAIEDGHSDWIVLATSRRIRQSAQQFNAGNDITSDLLAAAIVTHPIHRAIETNIDAVWSPTRMDAATLMVASLLPTGGDENNAAAICSATSRLLRDTLRQRGVRFLQWATDLDHDDEFMDYWLDGFALQNLGELDYCYKNLDSTSILLDESSLRSQLKPVDWQSTTSEADFLSVIKLTYEGTLDCPSLEAFRTVSQTLAGYRSSSAFAPSLWFTISDRDNEQALGVVVLAAHGAQPSNRQRVASASAIELVYMGLIPDARGHGLGDEVLQQIENITKQCDAKRLILAVDRENVYAKNRYKQFGMKTMLCESVFASSINP